RTSSLFVLAARAPRVIPAPLSFPTRRSSDLERVLHEIARPQVCPRDPRVLDGARDGAPPRVVFAGQVNDVFDSCLAGDTQHVGEDRKSTRLNSSHVKISYAAFCLKKKHIEQY